MNSEQILGNASSPERFGQFQLRGGGGGEKNLHCISGCLKGAASERLGEVAGGRTGEIKGGREAGKHTEVA